jgi:hypothetical protein
MNKEKKGKNYFTKLFFCSRMGSFHNDVYHNQQEIASPFILTLSFLMAFLEINWQSYNSILWRLWHEVKCSKVASVIKGQLSNSRTDKLSAAQLPAASWRIPSSVISSQCDKVCVRVEEAIKMNKKKSFQQLDMKTHQFF